MSNKHILLARRQKNDEFYTRYEDVEVELNHYTNCFFGKTIYCNCDSYEHSAFVKYFINNFAKFGLKKLIATSYSTTGPGCKFEMMDDKHISITPLSGDGDFRSYECVNMLKQADILCTNPPFSLFREYIHLSFKHNKKLLIIGNKNSIIYKEVFALFKSNNLWLGYSSPKDFFTPEGMLSGKMSGLTRWFTNLDVAKREQMLPLSETYSKKDYQPIDNYSAILVKRVVDIPKDYSGVMAVPVTFIDYYNPTQFELLGTTGRKNSFGLKTKIYTQEDAPNWRDLNSSAVIKTDSGYKEIYPKILIKHKI